jgi:hypothetical protein
MNKLHFINVEPEIQPNLVNQEGNSHNYNNNNNNMDDDPFRDDLDHTEENEEVFVADKSENLNNVNDESNSNQNNNHQSDDQIIIDENDNEHNIDDVQLIENLTSTQNSQLNHNHNVANDEGFVHVMSIHGDLNKNLNTSKDDDGNLKYS